MSATAHTTAAQTYAAALARLPADGPIPDGLAAEVAAAAEAEAAVVRAFAGGPIATSADAAEAAAVLERLIAGEVWPVEAVAIARRLARAVELLSEGW